MEDDQKKSIFSYSVFTFTLLVGLALGYSTFRLAAAEYAFGQSLVEASANRGNTAYNLQIQAIQSNPFEERYRITYSQINLALANSIASQQEIDDQQRATIQQLIQQSIREGKAAVSINPLNAGSWANLARIYRGLVNVATDANQWAVATFQQAIALDPNNPQLRLNYGQLLFSLNQFEAAQRQFEAAATLKPDLANARYNLALSLKAQDKFERAKLELQQTLANIEAGSNDFSAIQDEIGALDKLIADQQTDSQDQVAGEATGDTTESQLQSPDEASPAAVLNPPLELSKDDAPPQP